MVLFRPELPAYAMFNAAKMWNMCWWRRRPGYWTATVPRRITQLVREGLIEHVDGLCVSVSYWTVRQDSDYATVVVDAYGNEGVPIAVLNVFGQYRSDRYGCLLGIDAGGLRSNWVGEDLAKELAVALRHIGISAQRIDGVVRMG